MRPINAASPRVVEEEVLDSLSFDDPLTARIHRDIDRYNRILGHYSWIVKMLNEFARPSDRLLEIAAGSGRLLKRLHSNGALDPFSSVKAFDAVCEKPKDLPESIDWHVCRAEEFTDYHKADIIIVCNFYHQLNDHALRRLGAEMSKARLLLAAETHRSSIAYRLCQASRLIGFSSIGIGDGLKSLHAGFRERELPTLLNLAPNKWTVKTNASHLGWYRMNAHQRTS